MQVSVTCSNQKSVLPADVKNAAMAAVAQTPKSVMKGIKAKTSTQTTTTTTKKSSKKRKKKKTKSIMMNSSYIGIANF
jgi:hypothetical protein